MMPSTVAPRRLSTAALAAAAVAVIAAAAAAVFVAPIWSPFGRATPRSLAAPIAQGVVTDTVAVTTTTVTTTTTATTATTAITSTSALSATLADTATPTLATAPGYRGDPRLTASENAGREIWFNATAGNARFHTYTFQQRMGATIDWFRVLNARERADRFKIWGLINNPFCCEPGSPGCPAKSLEETFGLDWCEGDDALLPFVGRDGYRDPACDFADAPPAADDVHGTTDQRESACGLAFGTSAGAMGLRKFPNPRFDREAWLATTGSPATWEGFGSSLDGAIGDNRLADGSIEPPFLIGMACGACHIAFDPLHPPADPAKPEWANLDGLVGNQYARFSEIMASGMPTNSIEWQIFVPARPGATDTSAVPNDGVSNPGTQNALINLAQRPVHPHDIVKWRKAAACPAGADERSCWCEPGRTGKCWERSRQTEDVHNILKGGEDSIGAREAVQRVFFNIGSCAEACWVNHLTDLRQPDPKHRGYGQTPFDIGQCRRDCPNFRAVEDRLDDIVAFLFTARPSDLYAARGLPDEAALEAELDAEFAADFGAPTGAVARGRAVFTETCAGCHSSQNVDADGEAHPTADFRATVDGRPDLRLDWLGSDEPIPVQEVGTFRGRSLHSNHMAGHVWEEYGSDTLRARPADPAIREPGDGGRGYYRVPSLLSVWAHAPLLHNNAMGPELCGGAPPARELYRSPYIDAAGKPLADPPPCWPYDPSVAGRFALFKASAADLLNPDARRMKTMLLSEDIVRAFSPALADSADDAKLRLAIRIPQGVPVAMIGSLDYKRLLADLVRTRTARAELTADLQARYGDEAPGLLAELDGIAAAVVADPTGVIDAFGDHMDAILRLYASNTMVLENAGHTFGEELAPADKAALIAFLATL
ncbi:MAG: hypothetical protein IT332_02215 [Ardenticatenales bacterium]|nr:hypothetical protein [Ardenticatenales bacterium]